MIIFSHTIFLLELHEMRVKQRKLILPLKISAFGWTDKSIHREKFEAQVEGLL